MFKFITQWFSSMSVGCFVAAVFERGYLVLGLALSFVFISIGIGFFWSGNKMNRALARIQRRTRMDNSTIALLGGLAIAVCVALFGIAYGYFSKRNGNEH